MTADHWEGEDVIITFEQEGADTVTNFEGRITNIRVSGGSVSNEDKFAFGNKTIVFSKPREKFNVELEYFTTNPDFSNMNFGTVTNANVAGTTEIRSSSKTKRWRIVLWFQPFEYIVENATKTIRVPAKAQECHRIIFADCRGVNNDFEFAVDDTFKGTINFEVSATDASGFANIFDQYKATASSLTTLTTTAHKGVLTWNATTPAWTGSYRT
jgi:hypothetical protein